MHKDSTKKLIEKRRLSLHNVGASPAFNKTKEKKQSQKKIRKFGNWSLLCCFVLQKYFRSCFDINNVVIHTNAILRFLLVGASFQYLCPLILKIEILPPDIRFLSRFFISPSFSYRAEDSKLGDIQVPATVEIPFLSDIYSQILVHFLWWKDINLCGRKQTKLESIVWIKNMFQEWQLLVTRMIRNIEPLIRTVLGVDHPSEIEFV